MCARWRLSAFVPLLVAAVAACGLPCRDVETRDLEIACAPSSAFFGEIHFDNAESFETFLAQRCLSAANAEQAAALVARVDFTHEAVFFARGPSALGNQRCLRERRLARSQVCESGLRLSFDDELIDEGQACPATQWSVGFALARADLRAALDAADGVAPGAPAR